MVKLETVQLSVTRYQREPVSTGVCTPHTGAMPNVSRENCGMFADFTVGTPDGTEVHSCGQHLERVCDQLLRELGND